MPSPEGEGRAKNALEAGWQKYFRFNKAVNEPIYAAMPFLRNLNKGYTASRVFDAFGFWVWWRLCGGFEGVQKQLGLSPVSYTHLDVYKRQVQMRGNSLSRGRRASWRAA